MEEENHKKYKVLAIGILLFYAGITFLCFGPVTQLKFNYDIEKFFDRNNPDVDYYENFRNTFENDNDFILVSITRNSGIFDTSFLKQVKHFSREFEKLPLVNQVISPTNISTKNKVPVVGFVQVPLLHLDHTEQLRNDQNKIYSNNNFYRSLFSNDSNSLLVFAKKQEHTSKAQNDKLLSEIKELLRQHPFDQTHIAGRINTQNYYVSNMQFEFKWFISISVFLLILFLGLTYRRIKYILTPLVVLIFSLGYTLSVVQHFIGYIDLLTSLLPTLLFVIGISNSIHILSGFNEYSIKFNDKNKALSHTIKTIGKTTFLSSLTTAIGFLSLCFVDIPPIQMFGIFTSIGVMIAWMVSITLLPSMLILTKTDFIHKKENAGWEEALNKLYNYTRSKKYKIAFFTITIIIVSLIGISNLQSNNYFLENISESNPIRQETQFFEDNFSGIRPFEMGIEVIDSTKSLYDIEVSKELDAVCEYLTTKYGVGMLLSPTVLFKEINRSLNSGKSSFYTIPDSPEKMNDITNTLEKPFKNFNVRTLLTKSAKKGRITGKIKDLGRLKVDSLNKELNRYLIQNSSLLRYRVTGAANLMDQTSRNISKKLLYGLSFSLFIVALIIGFLLKNLKLALISLLPNVLPLLIIGAIMGISGIDLKVSTVVIFTIAYGIAVDDTIHILARYQHELKNYDNNEAVRKAIKTTGKAVILTSLILSSGFLTFIFSSFTGTYYIGVLISLTLILALFADLLLLPIFLFKKQK